MSNNIPALIDDLGRRAKAAAAGLARSNAELRVAALHAAADAILERSADIIAANAVDMQAAEAKGLSGSMLDRLLLD